MSTLAIVLFIAAVPFIIAEGRVCGRIVKRVEGEADALTSKDVWIAQRQGEKMRKLSRLAEWSPDMAVRQDAREALRLGRIVFALIAAALLTLMAQWVAGLNQHAG